MASKEFHKSIIGMAASVSNPTTYEIEIGKPNTKFYRDLNIWVNNGKVKGEGMK